MLRGRSLPFHAGGSTAVVDARSSLSSRQASVDRRRQASVVAAAAITALAIRTAGRRARSKSEEDVVVLEQRPPKRVRRIRIEDGSRWDWVQTPPPTQAARA